MVSVCPPQADMLEPLRFAARPDLCLVFFTSATPCAALCALLSCHTALSQCWSHAGAADCQRPALEQNCKLIAALELHGSSSVQSVLSPSRHRALTVFLLAAVGSGAWLYTDLRHCSVLGPVPFMMHHFLTLAQRGFSAPGADFAVPPTALLRHRGLHLQRHHRCATLLG